MMDRQSRCKPSIYFTMLRSKDFEDGIIFTSKEKAEKELEKLKGEINEERE